MPFAPFYLKFPEVAEAETRAVFVADHPVLAPGRYPFIEFYCNEPGCDCRRVIFHVVRDQTQTVEAEIGFGWEDRAFYVDWMGDDNPVVIEAMQGPAFNIAGPITEFSDVLLEQVREAVRDRAYVERLVRHYGMYRATIDGAGSARATVRRDGVKTGRNDVCPCGSGKKYKRCCGG